MLVIMTSTSLCTNGSFKGIFLKLKNLYVVMGLPGGSTVKNPPANSGDMSSIPGLGRSPGEGNGNPLQYSCLKIPWTEKPGRLQSMGLQRVGYKEMATHSSILT